MRPHYAEDCDCKSGVMPSFVNLVFWFGAHEEEKAIKLHLKLWRRLVIAFDSLENRERYWAIHVDGRHLIHVAPTSRRAAP